MVCHCRGFSARGILNKSSVASPGKRLHIVTPPQCNPSHTWRNYPPRPPLLGSPIKNLTHQLFRAEWKCLRPELAEHTTADRKSNALVAKRRWMNNLRGKPPFLKWAFASWPRRTSGGINRRNVIDDESRHSSYRVRDDDVPAAGGGWNCEIHGWWLSVGGGGAFKALNHFNY